jgi:hypothetical protein
MKPRIHVSAQSVVPVLLRMRSILFMNALRMTSFVALRMTRFAPTSSSAPFFFFYGIFFDQFVELSITGELIKGMCILSLCFELCAGF